MPKDFPEARLNTPVDGRKLQRPSTGFFMKSNQLPLSAAAAVFVMGSAFNSGPLRAADEKAAPPATVPAEIAGAEDWEKVGSRHWREIIGQGWAGDWKDAALEKAGLVAPKAGQTFPTGLPEVWRAVAALPDGRRAYLLWENKPPGRLLDFSLPGVVKPGFQEGRVLSGVPAIQQFPLLDAQGTRAASGCVPTAASSLIGFWIGNGKPLWSGTAPAKAADLREITRRVRDRLPMSTIPDKDGFTPDGMALSGSSPAALASAIRLDAESHGVEMEVRFSKFDWAKMTAEIDAGRPVLLSCVVRVPHLPALSWGHEIAGVAWTRVAGEPFVGVLDNFFPDTPEGTVRWLRPEVFQSLITARPQPAAKDGGP